MAVSRFNPDYPDAGLTLLNKTTFTGASTVSIDNVFSADYTNYRVLFSGVHASSDVVLYARMRLSGTDNTTSNYQHQRMEASGTGTPIMARDINQTAGRVGAVLTTNCIMSMDIYNPALAVPTQFNIQSGFRTSTGIQMSLETTAHNVSTAYDGITFYPASSTMTGTVRIYGYKDEV